MKLINLQTSKFITDCDPSFSQIISPSKYFQIVSVWNQFFNIFVNLSWFLTLPSSITKYDIACGISLEIIKISFVPNQACLFSMLKIESMSFGYFIIHSFFDPVYRINYFISPFPFHSIDSPLKFSIDHPNKKKSFFLKFFNRNLLN